MSAALELLRAAQEGDRDACEQAVLENNGLIWSVVRRYYGRGVEPDDLYQLGCLGFLKAVKGFDFAYGTCFSTYAVPKIAGEIRRFLRDDGTIKVGRSVREQSLTHYTHRERLRQELGREPSLSELAERIGWTPEEIAQIDLATEKPDSGDGSAGRCAGGADRPAGSGEPAAGKRADDHPAPLFQGADAGADSPCAGGVSGTDLPAGAPGAGTAAKDAAGVK